MHQVPRACALYPYSYPLFLLRRSRVLPSLADDLRAGRSIWAGGRC